MSATRDYIRIETFSIVEEYDPATDTWTTKSPMPTSRGWHSAIVVDGKIYIFGGSKNAPPAEGRVLAVEVYDPATDTWTQLPDMPMLRSAGSASMVDGKIYFFGGYEARRRVDEYNPATDTWTQKPDMPTVRTGLTTSVLDGKIYLMGGFGMYGYSGLSITEIYDPATDTWTTAPDMPTGRYGAYSSVVDGRIYVIGGMPGWPAEAYGIVEIYDLQND
jgi:N-acetylneuraminic acid mutarotase